jgi:hypothetical protein
MSFIDLVGDWRRGGAPAHRTMKEATMAITTINYVGLMTLSIFEHYFQESCVCPEGIRLQREQRSRQVFAGEQLLIFPSVQNCGERPTHFPTHSIQTSY